MDGKSPRAVAWQVCPAGGGRGNGGREVAAMGTGNLFVHEGPGSRRFGGTLLPRAYALLPIPWSSRGSDEHIPEAAPPAVHSPGYFAFRDQPGLGLGVATRQSSAVRQSLSTAGIRA